jgi:hypothetical protein
VIFSVLGQAVADIEAHYLDSEHEQLSVSFLPSGKIFFPIKKLDKSTPGDMMDENAEYFPTSSMK